MLILTIGDVIGKPGLKALSQLLPGLRRQYGIDLVMVNGENAAGGIGLTLATAREMLIAGADVLTSGNHIWMHREIYPYLDGEMPILRPLNYPPGVPGRGHLVIGKVAVVNLLGRVFIGDFDNPFHAVDKLLAELEPKIIMVDFHAIFKKYLIIFKFVL